MRHGKWLVEHERTWKGSAQPMKKSTSGTDTKRRPLRKLAVIVAAVAGMLTLVAAPALAETGQKCHPVPESNVCLAFWRIDASHYQVHLGIDFHIGRQRAQQIIDQPGDPFVARIFGIARQPIGNQALFTVPMTEVLATEDFGLSAGFDYVATTDQLNHDDYPWPFQYDRVFGRIGLLSAAGGTDLNFDTDSFLQNF
jgi:hypothetical protein